MLRKLILGLGTAVAALALVVGPVILLLRRWLGVRLTTRRAAVAGAAAGPLILIGAWLLVRERGETFGQLLSFWSRLPMELVLGALPYAAAGALFAAWLVPRRPPHANLT